MTEMEKLLADYDRDNHEVLRMMRAWLTPAEVKKSSIYRNQQLRRRRRREKLKSKNQRSK